MHLSQVVTGLIAVASPFLVVAAPVAEDGEVAFTSPPLNGTEITSGAHLSKRGFEQSCIQNQCAISRDTGTLFCSCWKSDGFLQYSELPLSKCLINSNGKLVWQRNGGAMASCNTQTISWVKWPRMDVECRSTAGSYVQTSVWLNERINNYNGFLDCIF